ncbi:TlpA family protein disulfide reductase [Niastella sp. OAS944]|uniref:TlpA family protein disulfide reductase n=1 Tax=Niastella sp. OAS944 TaxID=2664089 RepID=UPI00346F16A5|nr:thiol-disulfide isomerase/thioredoxin [Chitinophagaceae bacterium OAS944]
MFYIRLNRAILLAFLLCINTGLLAGTLVVTVDGSNNTAADTLQLTSDNELTGDRLLQLMVPVSAGAIKSYSYKTATALLMNLDGAYFIIGSNDSIAITFNKAANKYEIAGGRFPGNYAIYQAIKSVNAPFEKYRKADDNFEEYVQAVDSVTAVRYAMLNEARERNTMSREAYTWVSAYVKYLHLFALLFYKSSATFQKQFPQSGSRYIKQFQLSDFQKDELENLLPYALATVSYVTTIARLKDSSNYRTVALDHALDSFTGKTRGMLLSALMINSSFRKNISNDRLQQLLTQVNRLQLPKNYLQPITVACLKQLREGRPIDSMVLAGARLLTPDGRTITLKELLQLYTGKEVLIDFWASWCGPCIQSLPKVAKLEKDYAVCYVSLDTDKQKWKMAAQKHKIEKAQYLLINNYNSVLAAWLFISAIPRYIVLDASGAVKHVELRL